MPQNWPKTEDADLTGRASYWAHTGHVDGQRAPNKVWQGGRRKLEDKDEDQEEEEEEELTWGQNSFLFLSAELPDN